MVTVHTAFNGTVRSLPALPPTAPRFAGKREETQALIGVDHGRALRKGLEKLWRSHVWPTRPRIVERVADGDTFTVRGGTRVRLFGVDAPETNTEEGRGAQAYLRQLLDGRTVRLTTINIDRFDRHVAIVELQKFPFVPFIFENLNERMVRDGWAFASEQASLFTNAQKKYIQDYYKPLEAEARRNQLGMWADNGRPHRPWNQRRSA